jgi:predicted short-subunit dehydrogenase-like oxidoreductase (DUF2520 family)
MSVEINKLSIIGSGNVATHLALAFDEREIEVTHIFSRNEVTGRSIANRVNAEFTDNILQLPADQLCIVCVPDDQVSEIIKRIPASMPVAYTSGSVELRDIQTSNQLGVFYPLQTFSKDTAVDIFQVPFLIEAKDEAFASTLFDLAWQISRKVEYANSENRREIHLAAVWINNFVNHCIVQATAICKEYVLDPELLHPLLEETVQKALKNDPKIIQTGPARRGDSKTIEKHLDMQEGIRKELYEKLTKSIQNIYLNDQL